ncbi:MAG: hypothetical protein SangKO_067590 [Sandaracinaceae bacterium]
MLRLGRESQEHDDETSVSVEHDQVRGPEYSTDRDQGENEMLNEPTMDKLLALRLATMASAWAEQQKDPKAGALDFDERFGLLVDAEYLARDNRKVTRLLKAAKLRLSSASMEDVKTSSKKGLDRGTCNQLALRADGSVSTSTCS